MIKSILIKKFVLNFRETFTIAYESVDKAEMIIIKLVDEDGNYGLGCAAPDNEVTNETIDLVFDKLNKFLNKEFFDVPIDNWYKYHEKIQKVFNGFPSAQSAVEEALLNIFVNKKDINLVNLFGGYRDKCPIMITIGINNIEKTISDVQTQIKKGFKIIKLKCGLDYKNDIKKIIEIKKICSKDCQIVLDANQGYSLSEAKLFLKKIDLLNIGFLEQPIDANNFNGLKELKNQFKTKIIADESAVDFDDVYKLLTGDYVDGINIKLMKCGGPVNFIKIFNLAKELNKLIMIGCMYESNVSITTGAALALGLPLDYADLDSGSLDFIDDPAKKGAYVKNGEIFLGKNLELI